MGRLDGGERRQHKTCDVSAPWIPKRRHELCTILLPGSLDLTFSDTHDMSFSFPIPALFLTSSFFARRRRRTSSLLQQLPYRQG